MGASICGVIYEERKGGWGKVTTAEGEKGVLLKCKGDTEAGSILEASSTN